MRKILLSIKPEYVHRIFEEHSKRFEFRKRVPVNTDIHTAVVYATSPICRIVGEFDYSEIIVGSTSDVWTLSKEAAGTTKSDYDAYFKGCKQAHAFVITEVRPYHHELELQELGIARAPQSWMYVDQ